VKPQKNVKGLKNGLDLPKHMAENIYMFNGESIKVKMQADKTIINDIIDWFGSKVTFSNETENTCTVSLKINENAIFFWAMQYGEHVKILEPETLQERIKQSADNMAKKYTT
jgi:predicted DNA-binding transcriptional regulator YafY